MLMARRQTTVLTQTLEHNTISLLQTKQAKTGCMTVYTGTAHQSKCGRAKKGVAENFFEATKTPGNAPFENLSLCPLGFYKQSGLEKISISIEIDKISLVVMKHKKHIENEQKVFPVKKNFYYLGVYDSMLR